MQYPEAFRKNRDGAAYWIIRFMTSAA